MSDKSVRGRAALRAARWGGRLQMRSSAAHAGEVGKQHRTQLMAAAGALVCWPWVRR
ncbi:hypothetical protein SALBM217S_06291 [Streptomyces griseoloalbus]